MQQLWKEVEASSKAVRDPPPINGVLGSSGLLAFGVHSAGGGGIVAGDGPKSPGAATASVQARGSSPLVSGPPPLVPLPTSLISGLNEGLILSGRLGPGAMTF